MKRPSKLRGLMDNIRNCIEEDRYFNTWHSDERQTERGITELEILFVLKNGRHEPSKDKYEVRYRAWNYAVRGKSFDSKDLRIIVSFDENGMLIITAIEIK